MAVKSVDTEYTIVEVGSTVDPSNIINMYKDSKVVLVCTKDEEIIMQTKEVGSFTRLKNATNASNTYIEFAASRLGPRFCAAIHAER